LTADNKTLDPIGIINATKTNFYNFFDGTLMPKGSYSFCRNISIPNFPYFKKWHSAILLCTNGWIRLTPSVLVNASEIWAFNYHNTFNQDVISNIYYRVVYDSATLTNITNELQKASPRLASVKITSAVIITWYRVATRVFSSNYYDRVSFQMILARTISQSFTILKYSDTCCGVGSIRIVNDGKIQNSLIYSSDPNRLMANTWIFGNF
jgi:hypothetical protein